MKNQVIKVRLLTIGWVDGILRCRALKIAAGA